MEDQKSIALISALEKVVLRNTRTPSVWSETVENYRNYYYYYYFEYTNIFDYN